MANRDSPTETQLQSRLAHLAMLQGIVGRLAGHSAAVKNFNLTIAAALIAVAFDKSLLALLIAGVGVTVVFALLDAYYLALEKSFRELYTAVSIRPWEEAFDLSISQRPVRVIDVLRAIRSVSICGYYMPLLGGMIFFTYLLSYVQPDIPQIDVNHRPVGSDVTTQRIAESPPQHGAGANGPPDSVRVGTNAPVTSTNDNADSAQPKSLPD